MDLLRRNLNPEQLKLTADLCNTLAKLFMAGGMVAPFLRQVDIEFATGVLSVGIGFILHGLALYVVRTRSESEGPT